MRSLIDDVVVQLLEELLLRLLFFFFESLRRSLSSLFRPRSFFHEPPPLPLLRPFLFCQPWIELRCISERSAAERWKAWNVRTATRTARATRLQ